MHRGNVFFGLKSHLENGQKVFRLYVHAHNLTPIMVGKNVWAVHNGLQTYKRFVAMPI